MGIWQIRELPITILEMQHVFIAHFHGANKSLMTEHSCFWVASCARSIAKHMDCIWCWQLQLSFYLFVLVISHSLLYNLVEEVNIETDISSFLNKLLTALLSLSLVKNNQVLQ